jgi:hypothetical protein
MSKQETSQPSPQQLSFDLKACGSLPASSFDQARIVNFIDATTRSIREQAISRVRAAKIFEPPKSLAK